MTFKSKFGNDTFNKISVDNFIKKFKKKNPKEDFNRLKKDLLHFKQLKTQGETCNCGNELWIIGSAISGKGCFTCITGDTESSNDFEIE
jgi:hypothetical protein